MDTILVTGGSGLVGSALNEISKSFPNYQFVFASSNDVNLIDEHATNEYFLTIKPKYMIHLAAIVGGLFKNTDNNVEMFEDNIRMNLNVVKCAYKVGVKKMIACLSTCVYPNDVQYPITEDQFHNGEPHESNFGYAYAKRMLEVQCRAYNKHYGTEYICIIPTNIFGPNDNFSLNNGHVIPALIHKFHLANESNTKLILPGTGKAKRQFIFSYDIAKIIMKILVSESKYTLINICEDESKEISIHDIVKIISNVYSYYNYEFDQHEDSDGQLKKTASNKNMISFVTTDKKSKLSENIKTTISWFKEHFPNIRK